MTRRASRGGFTLLEMLLAMTLMAMLTVSLYTAMSAAFRGRRLAEASLEPARRAGAAFFYLDENIQSACVPTGLLTGLFLGRDAVGENGEPADVLLFHALSGEPSGSTPPTPVVRVEIALVEDAERADVMLVRRTTTNLLAPETQAPFEEVLCRRVRSFDVSYYDGLDWRESWDSTTQGDVLPLMMSVTLVLDAEEERTYTLARTFAIPCASLPDEPSGGGRGGATS